MCGRFTLTTPGEELVELFDLEETPQLQPRFNIAPSQAIAVVRRRSSDIKPRLGFLTWGLVPHWSRASRRNAMINARAETLAGKASFRDAFHSRRCLVPADGFYEWGEKDGKRRPFLFRLRDGGPFAIAGVWEPPATGMPDGQESCALITTDANALLAAIHDRMPALIPRQQYERWLDPAVSDAAALMLLLRPFPADLMSSVSVSRLVNNPRIDNPSCVLPEPS